MAIRLDAEGLERARRILRRRDLVLGRVIVEVGPCRMRPSGDPYRALVRSVLYQQLAGAAAKAIERRLRAEFGGRIPAAARLLAAPPTTLRRAGLSRQKVASLRAIAQSFEQRELSSRRLARMEDEDVVAAVTRVRGVGEWTAHMLLMFSLGRPDVLPVGDYGIRRGTQVLYGLDGLPGRRELEAVAEPWRPFRSVASWYIWRHAAVTTPG
jgi:DNA-3-methyladenine glycosylase II